MKNTVAVQEVKIMTDKGKCLTTYAIARGKHGVIGFELEELAKIHRIIGELIEKKGGRS